MSLCETNWYCTAIMWYTCIPPFLLYHWVIQAHGIHSVVNVFSLNGQYFILHTLDKMTLIILICIYQLLKNLLLFSDYLYFSLKLASFVKSHLVPQGIWWSYVIFRNIFVLLKTNLIISLKKKKYLVYEFKLMYRGVVNLDI